MTSLRIRDGDREIEVSGSSGFVRQVLEELPSLLARLRGEATPTPASIRMPAPAARPPAASGPEGEPDRSWRAEGARPEPATSSPPGDREAISRTSAGAGSGDALEDRVLGVLRAAAHPLPVAAIRERLGAGVTGQQVRRILERAGSRVVATGDRPSRYRLR